MTGQRPSSGMTSRSTAWRIVGPSGEPVECEIELTARSTWTITVTFCAETLLTESHPQENGARLRAVEVRDRLLRHGWKNV
jgi:hypothetical protein